MDKLTRDELILLSYHLDLPDLLSLCKSNAFINEKVCNNPNMWRNKISRDFQYFNLETLSNELKKKSYRELYNLLYLKRIWQLEEHINQIYLQEFLELKGKNIKEIPEEINLPKLKILYLSHNNITQLPNMLNLPNLATLDLSSNPIREIPKKFSIPSLQTLSIAFTNIKKIPKNVILPNLLELYIDKHQKKKMKLKKFLKSHPKLDVYISYY